AQIVERPRGAGIPAQRVEVDTAGGRVGRITRTHRQPPFAALACSRYNPIWTSAYSGVARWQLSHWCYEPSPSRTADPGRLPDLCAHARAADRIGRRTRF